MSRWRNFKSISELIDECFKKHGFSEKCKGCAWENNCRLRANSGAGD